MISYMVDREGFLIVNREVVSEDISDFEYSPMAKYPGPFRIFNVDNEEQLLRKFVSHVQELRPHVIVTYNGDFFDWPYVDSRCSNYALSLYKELGIRGSQGALTMDYQ
ncbi:pol2 [Symbiodinium microadriaticum]|nr:pol2 [Symbiodinium microadriaticum]